MLSRYRTAGRASANAADVVGALGPDPDVTPDPTAAAFFDVDNTLIRGASVFHLAVGLARQRYF